MPRLRRDHRSSGTHSRRFRHGAGALAALVVAYVGGVVTGVVGAGESGAPRSGALVEAADRIETQAGRPVPRSELERGAIEGMLRTLGDRWATYYRPAEFNGFTSALDGRYSGVGLWVRRDRDGRTTVATVQPGTPAGRAGVRAGDELIAVAGVPTAGRSVADVVAALRGGPGELVTVAVRRGGRARVVRLRRVDVVNADVTVDALTRDVIRIRIAAFTRGVARQVRAAVAGRDGRPRGVVLDLRDNPGGLLDEAVETASAFLSGGPVVSFERRNAPPRVLDAVGVGDTAVPLAVLVDGSTASAAEVVAGALQDRNRAVVIGSRTFGKGSVQEASRLSDGSALELTVGRYRTPRGTLLDGVGLEPDLEVAPSAAPRVAERRAVEVLVGVLADTGTNGRG